MGWFGFTGNKETPIEASQGRAEAISILQQQLRAATSDGTLWKGDKFVKAAMKDLKRLQNAVPTEYKKVYDERISALEAALASTQASAVRDILGRLQESERSIGEGLVLRAQRDADKAA